jgi:hypothetical protein
MSVVFATLSLKQRTVFNNMSLPLGVKFVSRGELVPQVWTCAPGVNLCPRGELVPQGWTCPPGVNLSPRGELVPQGWTWHPGVNLTPNGWTLYPRGIVQPFVQPQEWKLSNVSKNGGAVRGSSPLGNNSPNRGQLNPCGSHFTIGGQLHPWGLKLPLGAKLKAGLWSHPFFSYHLTKIVGD